MSSGYESEGTVDDWDSLEKLEDIMADFCQPPFDESKPNLRFGHLVIPVYLQTSYSMVEMITQAVREASDVSAVIFVMPRIIHRLVRTITVEGLDFLPDFNDQTLEYEWLLSVLRGNRAARGPGPNAWKQAESPMMRQEALVLPDEAFVVFHMDPNRSADCCLALIGIVQWASDVSQRTGSNIRILTTGSYFGNSFLSELAGIHSEYPVAHYELPIPTHVDLIPEQCVDNADGDSILSRIDAHVTTGADDERHAVLSIPPFKPAKLSLFLGFGVELGENRLLNRYVMDNGSAMVNRVTYQYDQSGFGPKAVIICVDSGHPIPEYLNEYTHAHIVLAKRCTRSVLDEDSCQLVTADIALTRAELEENQWWCHHVLIDPENLHIYPGADGINADEDATVYRYAHVEHDQSGAFVAACCAMSDWGVDVRRVLGCFIKAPWVLRETVKELEKNQIIKKGALELALTGSEDRVFRGVLDIVRYDYRLARLLSIPCPNPRARRLRVQIAVYILLKEDWHISTTSLPPDIHWGWGSILSSYGELWHGLALWKRISRDCSNFENLDTHVTREVSDSSGQLTLLSDGAVLFRAITRQLELTLNEIGKDFDNVSLPAHNIKDESEELPMDQLIEVWGDVSTSFYDQIVMTRRVVGDDDDEPRFEHTIWSTGVPVLLKVENYVDLFNTQNFHVFSTEFNCNVVFGICMKFLRLEDSSLVGVQWSLLPPMFV